MSLTLLLRILLLCAVCLLFVEPAAADAFDAALARAVAAKERALEANNPARWEEALRRFQEADAIRPTPETRYEVSVAARHLDQNDLAVESYQSALDMGLKGIARDKAREFVAAHAAKMARVEVQGPVGTQLRVAGLARGTLPLERPLVVFAGSIAVEAILPNGDVQTHSLELEAGERELLVVQAADDAAAATPDPGAPAPATLESPPQTTPATATSARPPPASPSPLGTDAQWSPVGPVAPTGSRGRGVGVGLLGTGGLLVVTSTSVVLVSGAQIGKARAKLAPLCAVPNGLDGCYQAVDIDAQPEAQAQVNTIETWKNARIASFLGLGVGGASALVGAVVLVERQTKHRRAAPAAVYPRPVLRAGGILLGLDGTF